MNRKIMIVYNQTNTLPWIHLVFLTIYFSSCGIYSFTGASISPDVKTISIPAFQINAPEAPPMIGPSFTEKTKDYFVRNTNLSLTNKEGDLIIEGTIVSYAISPRDISSADMARLNRLNVGIKIKYTNTKDKTQDFETVLTHYADYSSNASLTVVQNDLWDQISEKLVEDIFNRTVASW